MDKKFIGNMLFQIGCCAGCAYSCFGMNNAILGLVFLTMQTGTSFMHWDD